MLKYSVSYGNLDDQVLLRNLTDIPLKVEILTVIDHITFIRELSLLDHSENYVSISDWSAHFTFFGEWKEELSVVLRQNEILTII